MRIEELVKKYYFHDSLLDNIIYVPNQNRIEMIIDFCYWIQQNFIPGSSETGMIKLIFSGVKLYKNPTANYDSDSILELHVHQNTVIFDLLNDNLHKYYEIMIEADSVEFVELPD